MSNIYDDLDYPPIKKTYCKKHEGLWPHECGCSSSSSKRVRLQLSKKELNALFWNDTLFMLKPTRLRFYKQSKGVYKTKPIHTHKEIYMCYLFDYEVSFGYIISMTTGEVVFHLCNMSRNKIKSGMKDYLEWQGITFADEVRGALK